MCSTTLTPTVFIVGTMIDVSTINIAVINPAIIRYSLAVWPRSLRTRVTDPPSARCARSSARHSPAPAAAGP